MKLFKSIKFTVLLLTLMISLAGFAQPKDKFVIVLDAGHGGKDYGAVYGEFIEKNIALSVVLKIGQILEKNKSIKVIYTREDDVFVELIQRAAIANKAHANFFLSIHCNASKAPASGTESFVMGTTKIASNLEVAKKENAVITLENDYKSNYEGYDPNAIESVIGITMLQEEHMDQSIALASMLQSEYTDHLNRKNRGVKQAPFLVLHKAFMPSVLTELGFISNKEEGKFLNSEEGQNKIADAIALAIINYKNGYIGNATLFAEKEVVKSKTYDNKFEKKDTNSKKQSHDSKVNKKEKKNVQENIVVEENIESVLDKGNKQLTYKIQIATGAKKIKPIPSNFKGLDSISISEEQMKFKYYYGETVDYEEAKLLLKRARKVGYKSSFIITLNQ